MNEDVSRESRVFARQDKLDSHWHCFAKLRSQTSPERRHPPGANQFPAAIERVAILLFAPVLPVELHVFHDDVEWKRDCV